MKKILKYISLLAGVAFLTAACSQSDIDGNASDVSFAVRIALVTDEDTATINGVKTFGALYVGAVAAMRLLWTRTKQLLEPSSATVLAAVLANPALFARRRVGIILSGGNVDLDALPALFALAGDAQP